MSRSKRCAGQPSTAGRVDNALWDEWNRDIDNAYERRLENREYAETCFACGLVVRGFTEDEALDGLEEHEGECHERNE